MTNAKTLHRYVEEYNKEKAHKEQIKTIYHRMLGDLSSQAKEGNFYSLWFVTRDMKAEDEVLLLRLLREDGFKVVKTFEKQYRIEW